ncbi:MAG: hypothetical protein II239_03240 [Peptococcaceae bacterium]|nr:hypothetical protein [Peptococcaceae bacterium]
MTNTILSCCILAIIVFGIQLTLCLKISSKVAKRIPVYFIILLYLIALVMYLTDTLSGSEGFAIWIMAAYILAVLNTVALASDLAAWIVAYIITHRTPQPPTERK